MKKKSNKPKKIVYNKVAVIVDNQKVWNNLSELKGESFLLKLDKKFQNKFVYVIENLYKNEYTILESDEKGNVVSWSSLAKKPISDFGYDIL